MSTHATPSDANVWLDGDAYRGKAGAPLPDDPFKANLDGFLPFGGIEAGFTFNSDQTATKKKVWNHRNSAYRVIRDPLDEGVTFRAVDNNEATRLTRAMGGKVTVVNKRYRLEKGDGEEFSLIVRLDDGADNTVIFYPRATLDGAPTRAAMDGQNLDGWEFKVTALEKPIEILPGEATESGSHLPE